MRNPRSSRVNDCDDACPDSMPGEMVDESTGCIMTMLTAQAGADLTVFSGESFTRVGAKDTALHQLLVGLHRLAVADRRHGNPKQ